MIALIITMIVRNNHSRSAVAAFTFIEALVAISLIGVGVATSLTALLKSIPSPAWRATPPAHKLSPKTRSINFSPIHRLIPKKPISATARLRFQRTRTILPRPMISRLGTHTYSNVPIYKDPDNGVVVSGTITTVISDVSQSYNGNTIPMYQAVVTVTYRYLNRTYTTTASTLRVSDI